jgi:secreted trypsin-like serine protease
MDAWLWLSQNQQAGDGGTCFCDSEGSVFWTEPDGTEILVGITSWGDDNCVSNAFNYHVDILSTLDNTESVVEMAGGDRCRYVQGVLPSA